MDARLLACFLAAALAPALHAAPAACPVPDAGLKGAFVCARPLADDERAQALGGDVASLEGYADLFKNGRLPPAAAKDYLTRFDRVSQGLALQGPEKQYAEWRYLGGPRAAAGASADPAQARAEADKAAALLRDPKLSGRQRQAVQTRLRALQGALGSMREDSGLPSAAGGPAAAGPAAGGPAAPGRRAPDYRALNAAPRPGPTTVKVADVPPPTVSGFVTTFVGGLGDHANSQGDQLIGQRNVSPLDPKLARSEHDKIMYGLVDYTTDAYEGKKARVVMDALTGAGATIAYEFGAGWFVGVRDQIVGDQPVKDRGAGLMGHWTVAASEYVRAKLNGTPTDEAYAQYKAGIADFKGDLAGVRRKIGDDLDNPNLK